MHVNESSENYLETILMLSKKLPVVRAVDIATELNFKKSSVSVAMKKLRESEHIIVSREGYITLTESGQAIADMSVTLFSLPGLRDSELTHRLPLMMLVVWSM